MSAAQEPPPSTPRPRGARATDPDATKRARKRVSIRSRIKDRLADANFASAIYGEVLVLSVLAVLGADAADAATNDADAITVLVTVVSSQLVFWLAHGYAQTIDQQLRSPGGAIGRKNIAHIMGHEWPIVQAAGPAIVLMALALLGAIDTQLGIDIAIGLAVLSLFGWGFAAGRRSRDTLAAQLTVGALSGSLGLVIVALKLAIH